MLTHVTHTKEQKLKHQSNNVPIFHLYSILNLSLVIWKLSDIFTKLLFHIQKWYTCCTFFLGGGGYKDDTRIGTVSMVLLTDLEFYYSNVILCLNCLLLFIVTSIANLLRHDKYMVWVLARTRCKMFCLVQDALFRARTHIPSSH